MHNTFHLIERRETTETCINAYIQSDGCWRLRLDAPVGNDEYPGERLVYIIPNINEQAIYGDEYHDDTVLAATERALEYLDSEQRPEATIVREKLIPYLEKYAKLDIHDAREKDLYEVQSRIECLWERMRTLQRQLKNNE